MAKKAKKRKPRTYKLDMSADDGCFKIAKPAVKRSKKRKMKLTAAERDAYDRL